MKIACSRFVTTALGFFTSLASATIWQNEQVRDVYYPDTSIPAVTSNSSWRTYEPNAPQLSYKGRWDSKHISWWSAPGLKFAFTGDKVALSFGNYTSPGVLVAYRLDGQDWLFTNVSASGTHLFITSSTPGFNLATSQQLPRTFELRVTNWAYGVQLAGVHLGANGTLIRIPNHSKTIEFIGDSLSAGMYASYEGLSSFPWGVGAGLGNVEFSVTAYPGICLVDKDCWGNPRGQIYQWLQTSDTSGRAAEIYGEDPELWDFEKHPAADLTIINIGTNDNNTHNNVTSQEYLATYLTFVDKIHTVWPDTQIILLSLWNGFGAVGSTYQQNGAFIDEIHQVYQHYEDQGFVHYFNTTGILQHNDIAPQWHPTDVGHIKVASHLMQYIKNKFGWEFGATGPEVFADTLYWNDEPNY